MKRFVLVIIASILAITLFSCEKETDSTANNDNTNDNNKDFYYVKYEISGKVYFYIDGVSYSTENGTRSESFSAARSFERISGPVSKNFVARITLTDYRGAPESNATKISVSKNNGPFAIKAFGQYSATYTINF
ncbi:MAG: hypothetical protein K1V70_05055 [Alistipes sp.]|jgi:hypothetical protein